MAENNIHLSHNAMKNMNHEAKDKYHLDNQKIRGQEERFQEKQGKHTAIKEIAFDKKQQDLNALRSEGKENGRIQRDERLEDRERLDRERQTSQQRRMRLQKEKECADKKKECLGKQKQCAEKKKQCAGMKKECDAKDKQCTDKKKECLAKEKECAEKQKCTEKGC